MSAVLMLLSAVLGDCALFAVFRRVCSLNCSIGGNSRMYVFMYAKFCVLA